MLSPDQLFPIVVGATIVLAIIWVWLRIKNRRHNGDDERRPPPDQT